MSRRDEINNAAWECVCALVLVRRQDNPAVAEWVLDRAIQHAERAMAAHLEEHAAIEAEREASRRAA